MKKLMMILGSVLLINQSMAQDVTSGGIYKDNRVRIGFKGAATISNMSKFPLLETITPEFRNALSPGGGLFFEIPLYKNFSVQPEFNYINKGFKIKEGIDVASKFAGVDIPISGSLRMKLNYVAMPILAKFHIGNKDQAHTYFMVGPSVNYLAKAGLRINILNIIPLNTPFPKSVFKPIELSGVAALGTEQPITEKVSFVGEVRYEAGLSRTINLSTIQLPIRNRTASASMGLSIKI